MKFGSTVKIGQLRTGLQLGGIDEKLTRSTPTGVQLVPQPGANGSKQDVPLLFLQFLSVGSACVPPGPAVFVIVEYWTPLMALELKSCDHRRAGVRLQ